MAKKNLATAAQVTTALRTNSVIVEIGGSIRRISINDLMNVINTGDEQLLRQVAWGVPCKENQSAQNWGTVGNTGMFKEYCSQVGRYLVTNDGKAAKLSNTNSGIFADGTTLDETKGHVMVIAPKLYYVGKTESATGITTAWFSMLPIGGEVLGNCNSGNHICMGAYIGSVVNNKLTSRSGQQAAYSHTIDWFWNAAQANGKNWGLVNYDHQKWHAFMGLSKYGNPNIQTQLGYGCGGTGCSDEQWTGFYPNYRTGATKSYGDDCCSVPISKIGTTAMPANSCHVSMFGVEDNYNTFWMMTQGVYFGSSANSAQTGDEIYIYEGNRMPSSAELSTHPTGNYRSLTRPTTSGYVKKMILGEKLDLFAKELGGGSTSYWGDQSYNNATGQLLLWGGSAYNGSSAGLGVAYSTYAWSYSISSCGSRLAYYGPLTFMSGKELMESVA